MVLMKQLRMNTISWIGVDKATIIIVTISLGGSEQFLCMAAYFIQFMYIHLIFLKDFVTNL
jgi:hypothetical protein